MGKHVIVIASGETERQALPHLVKHLEADAVRLIEVRIPPGNKALNLEMAEKLIKAAWYERIDSPPDKFVVLADVDGKSPLDVLSPFRQHLASRLGPNITASLQLAYAQWHLEAWYFADEAALRSYLGRALGSVDTSAPDDIQNPKLHLKNLLGDRAYTAIVSQEIARALSPTQVAQRSLSFRTFLAAVANGTPQAIDASQ